MRRPNRLPLLSATVFLLAACDEGEPQQLRPVSDEVDHQVKRLREDTELELQDLRGRWLAAEGLLTQQQRSLKQVRELITESSEVHEQRLELAEVAVAAVTSELEALRVIAANPPGERTTVLQRLARSYEEIHCLRKRGAEEAVVEVYGRYGFESADSWAEAWLDAARSESFEREVSARVERLCP